MTTARCARGGARTTRVLAIGQERTSAAAALRATSGIDVTIARSAGHALDLATQASFDVALVDLSATDIDGVELLELFAALRARSGPTPAVSLTRRERQILERFRAGERYDEVARSLSLSINTVRTHVRSIYDKLDVCSKTEAVVVATRLGLLSANRR